jgi:hypothetical protein
MPSWPWIGPTARQEAGGMACSGLVRQDVNSFLVGDRPVGHHPFQDVSVSL